MKTAVFAVVVLLGIGLMRSECASAEDLMLAENGTSPFVIVVADGAQAPTLRAADELQRFVKEATGATLPIQKDSAPLAAHEIVIGENAHLRKLAADIDLPGLGKDGFTIRTVGPHIVIVGGSDQGTLYGVYTFLENYLGCRWYSATVSRIPKRPTVTLGAINVTQKPVLQFREVYYSGAMDPDFAARQKLNGNASIIKDGKMVAEKHRGWNMWCHSFSTLVPPEKYFKEHPEYFSLFNGKRTDNGQLCVTNPEVLKITIASLKERMAADSVSQYWSVSQNDNEEYCQCDACKAVNDREGTPMGSVLEFVNKVAAEFPDKKISTLAYVYTLKPPKSLRPAKNVLITLCSVDCNRSLPLADDPRSVEFRDDLTNWAKICDNMFVWDYVIQFSNLVDPFPNLFILQPNVRFFVANHAKGMFAQGNREAAGEFAELRAYLLAKLLWDPNCDFNAHLADFLEGYYGAAAEPIRKYIGLMQQTFAKSGTELNIFAAPKDHAKDYLSPEMLAQYAALFDDAERRVEKAPGVLSRVQAARLPILFAQVETGAGSPADREKALERLSDIAHRTGLLYLTEGKLAVDVYVKDAAKKLE